ncbi:hypothetical protein FRB95_011198 [Tulasnella sp. JGI-2019a]|nr:hypothetical protein FRB95_011198 [Tulasnella sp. JGI-2019a]
MKKLHEMQPDAVIVSQAHLGHTPNLTGDATPLASTSLASQMESAFDMVDSLRASYPKAKLVVAGHSIGGWMSLQAMKATPTVVDAVFLITPTISNLATTPNGQSLTWLFWPISAAVAGLASPILGVMPFPFFSLCLGSHWPRDQLAVIKSMLLHPKATVAALYMARDEMDTVKTLDIATLQAYNDRIYTYYATNDDWVGDEKPAIIEILGRTERLYEDTSDTPHSFCITDRHSLRVATQCSRWMDMLREHGAHDQAR